jgi:DNA repair protein RadC
MNALKKTATITPLNLSKNVSCENPFQGISDDAILAKAEEICLRRLRMPGVRLGSPSVVKSFLTLKLGHLEYECFTILCLAACRT